MIQFVIKLSSITGGDILQYNGYKDIDMFYDRVRSLLMVNETSLPDNVIDFPENAQLSESIVKSMIPEWESLPDSKKEVFESAVVCQTAIVMYGVTSGNAYKVAQTQSLKVEYAERSTDTMDFLKSKLDSLVGVLNEGKEINLIPIFDISG